MKIPVFSIKIAKIAKIAEIAENAKVEKLEAVLGPFAAILDHFGTILEPFWVLGPFCDHFGTFRIILGQVLDYLETNWPFCGKFRFSGPKT